MTLPFEPQYKDNRKTISCKEKGKEYIGRNPTSLLVGCFRPEQDPGSKGKACDYLLEVGSEKAVFIELKGVDLASAFSQVLETCKRYKECLSNHTIRVRVIGQCTPKTIPSSRLKLDQFLLGMGRKEGASIKGRVIVRSSRFEEDI